jgi:hypothetical protein
MSGLSATYHQHPHVPPQLVQSSSSSTIHSTSSTATAYLNETIAKASALPESFYPEFLQYSKESFEQSTSNKKRMRSVEEKQQSSSSSSCSSEDEDEEKRPSRKQKTE